MYFINFLLWLLLGCIFASLSEWIAFKHRRNFGEFFRPIVKILFLIALGTVIPLFLFLLWNLILVTVPSLFYSPDLSHSFVSRYGAKKLLLIYT